MTPINKVKDLYFKREDLNPTGSAKDRALPLQIQNLITQGYQSAVISSTGNAAISASYYCHQAQIPLTVFLSPKVKAEKKAKISDKKIETLTPISDAIKFSKTNHSYLLRQSTDPTALTGYSQIADELLTQIPELTSIFIPVGSGTTLLGIAKKLPPSVKIFAVQPASNPSLCQVFDPSFTPETETITDSLSVRYLPLKNKLISTIKLHQGTGLIVPNSEAIKYLDFASQFHASAETALCLAGYYQALSRFEPGDTPVILVTGTKR